MGVTFLLVEQVGLLKKTGTSLFAAVLLHSARPLWELQWEVNISSVVTQRDEVSVKHSNKLSSLCSWGWAYPQQCFLCSCIVTFLTEDLLLCAEIMLPACGAKGGAEKLITLGYFMHKIQLSCQLYCWICKLGRKHMHNFSGCKA